ncbi:MAG: tetratricopeptide repeat protein [Nitrospirota bacterium]
MKIDKALQSAYQYCQSGDLNRASSVLKQILRVKPNNIDALHFLGMICCQLEDYDNALRYIRKEIEITPSNADAYNNLGLVLQAKGLLSEAIDCFRKAITLNPLSPQAYYNLGFAFQNTGQLDEAILNYQKAIQIEPRLVEAYNNLGILLRAKGRLEEAVTCFQKAIQINPNYANTYNNLGLSLQDKGDIDEAIANYKKAIHLNPDFADAYYNLAIALQDKKQIEEAISFYRKALQLNPNYPGALNNLGNIYLDKKQLNEAIDCYQEALKLKPDFVDAYNNLGIILQEKGQIDEAIINFQKALQINPVNPDIAKVHINLGTAFLKKDELEKAMICFQKALQKKPDFVDAYNKIGFVLQNKCRLEEAIQYFQKAIQIEPDHVDSHFGLSFPLLLSGNFEQGWKEYEWRRKTEDFISNPRDFLQPLWDGFDISGKTILLHAEQGLGDVIQFIRYVPLVVEKGAKIIIECQYQLISLFQNIEGVRQIIAQGEPLPSFDIHCPLLSLPLIFGTTVDNIPAEMPYIKVNAALLRKWEDKVEDDNSKLKVGLAWAGSPAHKNDHKRSFPLDTFKPLAQFDNIVFYSLQKGNGSEQAKSPPDRMKFIDHTDEIHDFSDTAALIMNLDLVISADTAVVHLAGALGKPVWTLLPFVPDWRWMLNREDSPWYPTMRLFRQPSPGDWIPVIDNVSAALAEMVIKREH